MKKLILLFGIISCFSCSYIARKGYGAKKTKTENKKAVEKWLTEKGFSIEHVVSVVPEYYDEYNIGMPQSPHLFDRNTGNFLAIGFTNGEYCPKEVDKSFSSVIPYSLMKEKPDSFIITETTFIPPGNSIRDKDKFEKRKDTVQWNLKNFLEPLRTLTGDTLTKIKPEIDYVLILPFAIYLGKKLQADDLKKYYFSARTNRFAKIEIIFLNLDKQEWWEK